MLLGQLSKGSVGESTCTSNWSSSIAIYLHLWCTIKETSTVLNFTTLALWQRNSESAYVYFVKNASFKYKELIKQYIILLFE